MGLISIVPLSLSSNKLHSVHPLLGEGSLQPNFQKKKGGEGGCLTGSQVFERGCYLTTKKVCK